MKTKTNLLVIGAIVFAVVLNSCNSQENKSNLTEQNSTTAKITYTCPMHPEVTSDVPGKCPKCGMELIEKKDDDDSMNMSKDSMNMEGL